MKVQLTYSIALLDCKTTLRDALHYLGRISGLSTHTSCKVLVDSSARTVAYYERYPTESNTCSMRELVSRHLARSFRMGLAALRRAWYWSTGLQSYLSRGAELSF